jgi:ribosomal-protein-alanine N-acetyltransferase
VRLGFAHVGVRKGYYPAQDGRREDAVVMSLAFDDVAVRNALD